MSYEQGLFEEQDAVGLVPDQGEDESDLRDSSQAFSASVSGKDWTVETLVSQMRKGRIDLAPSFQRRNAWLGNRKSKLIESIVLGFPIPQIVLAEDLDTPGHFFVLDGKQRLLALRQFFVDRDDSRDEFFDPLTLTGLEVLSSLNGKTAKDLELTDPAYLALIENFSIRTVVLSRWNSESLLLSLFLRLNTGSLPLSPQELRQALIPGPFVTWLDQASGELGPLRELLGNPHADRRMIDAELALRHIAFSESPLEYRGNLKQFLDDSCRHFNRSFAQGGVIEGSLQDMSAALSWGLDHFGAEKVCRKWSRTRFERAINRAVFDVQIYSFAFEHVRAAAEGSSDELLAGFQRLCDEDQQFNASISATTKTADAFRIRHAAWRGLVRDVCSVDYPLPGPLDRG